MKEAHGRAMASGYRAKYYLFSDSIRMTRSDGALVRLTTRILEGESANAAQARIMKTTFFSMGEQFWTIPLPVCPKCDLKDTPTNSISI